MTIVEFLHSSSKQFPNKIAIIDNGQEISYRDLWNRIGKLSATFYKIGICEKHRVALILPNSIEFICCFFALLKINSIIAPLSPDLTLYELKTVFHNFNPHAIISSSIFIEKVCREYPSLLNNKALIIQGGMNSGVQVKNSYDLNKLYKLNENNKIDDIDKNKDHIATINYTYRGLGYPLGAMLSHKNYVEGILAYIDNTRMSYQHRVLSFLPLSNIYPLVGCMLAPLMSGATIVISRNYMPRSLFKIIGTYGIHHFTTVPQIYNLLLQFYKEDEYDLSSLTCCITGGSYMPEDVQHAIKTRMGIDIFQGYGLTECLPVTWNRYEYNKPGTLGLPLREDFQIKIVGEDSEQKGINEVGEIIIDSPTVMQGYYKQEQETAEVLKDGCLYTGDYGYVDEEGYLHFTGLKKKVVKVNGNKVDLKELEDVLLLHPLVFSAHVYMEEEVMTGQTIVAEISSEINVQLTENEIKFFCSRYLSSYKVPRKIKITTEVALK